MIQFYEAISESTAEIEEGEGFALCNVRERR